MNAPHSIHLMFFGIKILSINVDASTISAIISNFEFSGISTLLSLLQKLNASSSIVWRWIGIEILSIIVLSNANFPIALSSEFSGISTVFSCEHRPKEYEQIFFINILFNIYF